MNCFTAMDMRLTGLLLASFVILAPAMYFDLGEQEEKCIIEEIPEDTLVSGQWRVLLLYNVIYICSITQYESFIWSWIVPEYFSSYAEYTTGWLNITFENIILFLIYVKHLSFTFCVCLYFYIKIKSGGKLRQLVW